MFVYMYVCILAYINLYIFGMYRLIDICKEPVNFLESAKKNIRFLSIRKIKERETSKYYKLTTKNEKMYLEYNWWCCITTSCQTECLVKRVFVLVVQSYKTYEIDLILIFFSNISILIKQSMKR